MYHKSEEYNDTQIIRKDCSLLGLLVGPTDVVRSQKRLQERSNTLERRFSRRRSYSILSSHPRTQVSRVKKLLGVTLV